ncbi:phage tail protein [Aeromonas hydrophila]|uniref:phage tail-collar fiber domain-containing protein n=1 Tax=Aeromonas hydrophila TaxID=644 RepID=UPI0005ED7412|nr:phage tail protein [Aeromonas hydrophila]QPR86512.1 phage tail protein [Aeromonas hydrophila]
MSQIITNAFSRYWQECLATQVPVVLDEFVLANVPGLDPDAAINPDSGLPPAGQIVHRHGVDQRGRINNDAVAYTIVMDTTVGDFSFNAMYLINKASGVVGMIVHKGLETKLKTNEATGQTGNSLVKSMLMEYDRAAEATATHVDASTWQIDYAARLRGMDDDLRLQALQFFGPATFYGDGFKLLNESGVYKVQPGVAYVGGLRAELNEVKKVTPGAKPVGLWLDIYRAGSLLDAWVNHFTLTLSVPELTDYLDSNGHQHHVAKVAIVNADGSVTDVRRKRTIELTGDVAGKGILEDAQGVTIAVEIKDGSHRHQWGELDQVPATASRWPSYAEVTDKPTLEQMGGYPKTGGPLDGGVDAKDAIYARVGLIARSRAGSTSLGMETPENANPYISARASGENNPVQVVAFEKEVIRFNKATFAGSAQIGLDAGLRFAPNGDFSGTTWGLGINAETRTLGLHRYENGAWSQQVLSVDKYGTLRAAGLEVEAEVKGNYVQVQNSGNPAVELHQPGNSAVMMYKPQNAKKFRFCQSTGNGGEHVGWGEIDADGFSTVQGRFRANYPAANRSWTGLRQNAFNLNEVVVGSGSFVGVTGGQLHFPGQWAVEFGYGVYVNENASLCGHVLNCTDGGTFHKFWQFRNDGLIASPAGGGLQAGGIPYGTAFGGYGDMVTWANASFALKQAASGNADVVAGSYHAIGAYVFAALIPAGGKTSHGQRAAGAYLRPCSAAEWGYAGYSLPGTWQCMGDIMGANDDERYDDRATLWIRVA